MTTTQPQPLSQTAAFAAARLHLSVARVKFYAARDGLPKHGRAWLIPCDWIPVRKTRGRRKHDTV